MPLRELPWPRFTPLAVVFMVHPVSCVLILHTRLKAGVDFAFSLTLSSVWFNQFVDMYSDLCFPSTTIMTSLPPGN